MKKVVIVGGSGFVGRHLSARLCKDYSVLIVSRNPNRIPPVRGSAEVRTRAADVFNETQMDACLQDAFAVINLVGILNEKAHDGSGFEKAHAGVTKALIGACQRTGVQRLLQMSALGVDTGISHYARSKLAAETQIKQSGLRWTIIRPSVIFGPGDSFLSRFAMLLKIAKGWFPLAGANARLQPVYVGDVVEVFAQCLEQRKWEQKTCELGGPKIYTLQEIVQFVAQTLGLRRWVPRLPDPLARMQAAILEWVPGKPFSLDNYRSLQTDNVTDHNSFGEFDITPQSMEAIAPRYLAGASRQAVLQRYRSEFGRPAD